MDEQTNDNDVNEVKLKKYKKKKEILDYQKPRSKDNEEEDENDEEEDENKVLYGLAIILISILFVFSVFSFFSRMSLPSGPKVVFFRPNSTTTSKCSLLDMLLIEGNENFTEFEFNIEIERPWAKLEGNWKGYDFKFRKFTYDENNGIMENNIEDWETPVRAELTFSRRLNIREALSMEMFAELQIETNAPIKGKDHIKVRYDVDCQEAIQKWLNQILAKMK